MAMDRPEFHVTYERLRAYAEMFGIHPPEDQWRELAEQFGAGLEGLAALRDVDIGEVEPFATFPVDRQS
jgi:hypothetical protein